MPSRALESWEVGESATRLDELLGVHVRVAGGSRGRRWATRELNAAIVVHVAAHQQFFCRDLHTEAADALVDAAPTAYKPMLRRWYTDRRSLDGGNAWPETIDRDFARFDLDVWAVARIRDRRTDGRLDRLRQLSTWRRDRPSGHVRTVTGTAPGEVAAAEGVGAATGWWKVSSSARARSGPMPGTVASWSTVA